MQTAYFSHLPGCSKLIAQLHTLGITECKLICKPDLPVSLCLFTCIYTYIPQAISFFLAQIKSSMLPNVIGKLVWAT